MTREQLCSSDKADIDTSKDAVTKGEATAPEPGHLASYTRALTLRGTTCAAT